MLCNRASRLLKGQQTVKIVTSHLLWTMKVTTERSAAVELLLSTLRNQEASILIPQQSLNPHRLIGMSHDTHQPHVSAPHRTCLKACYLAPEVR